MTDSNPWADQWQKAQQQFVSAWSDMAKAGSADKSASQADIWADSFELWRKASMAPAQADVKQVMDKSMDMARGYFTMAEQIGNEMAKGAKPGEAMMQWLEQLKTSLAQYGNMAAGADNPDLNNFMQQWFKPASSWQQMTAAMNPMAQSMGQMPGMNSGVFNMGEAIDPIGKILSSPGIGYFREPQEKQQKGVQLGIDYQQANYKFNQAFMRVSMESIKGFQQHLMGMDGEDTPKSLRQLYDLWVEISEQHYAKFAMSEEYQSLYGDMVNRLMTLKKHHNEIIDDMLNAMNLPSTSEVDTMQMRLQQLRRENIQLKKDVREIRLMLQPKAAASTKKPAPAKITGSGRKAAAPKKAATAKKAAGNKKALAAKAKAGANK